MKTLYLIRGVPGSGKSTYAKSLGLKYVFEADMFMEENGEYKFNPKKLGWAHNQCQRAVYDAMKTGEDIAVSNTFVKKWEMIPYLQMASEFGYNVVEKTMTGDYPNVHGCPKEKVEEMKRRFEA